MKFRIKRQLLNKALSFAYKPILSVGDESLPLYVKSVCIEVSNKKISFYGTNLDTLYAYNVEVKKDECEVERVGKCLLYAKTFFTLLKKYAGDDWVDCEIVQNDVADYEKEEYNVVHSFNVKYKKSNQSLGCELKFEWPADKLKIKDINNSFKIPSSIFVDSVGRVLFACGNNPERADLRNLCVQFSGNKIFFVATSGPNLAVYESTSEYQQQEKRMLLRKDAIPSDKKLLNEDKEISISFGTNSKKNEVIYINHDLGGDSFDIYAKPIRINGPDGNDFPNWRMLYDARLTSIKLATTSRKDCYDVLDRLCVVSPSFCIFSIVNDEISFSGGTHEKIQSTNCNFNESLTSTTFKNNMICINSTMFRDSVKNIKGDTLSIASLNLENGASLVQLSSPEDPDFVFLLNTLREEAEEEVEALYEEEEEVPF